MITLFEKFEVQDKYYKIFINGSLEKFEIALKKLGYYKEFCYDWGIENYPDDISEENLEYFNKDVIFLCITQKFNKNEMNFLLPDKIFNGKYCGEIHIEDYEVGANKYNL